MPPQQTNNTIMSNNNDYDESLNESYNDSYSNNNSQSGFASNGFQPGRSMEPDLSEVMSDGEADSQYGGSRFSETTAEPDEQDLEERAVSCFRGFVLFLLVGAMVAAGITTWHFLSEDQEDDLPVANNCGYTNNKTGNNGVKTIERNSS